MKCFGYYIVKPLAKPEWCTLNAQSIISVSEDGLSEKFPDLTKCFWINYPERDRIQYQRYLQLSDNDFNELCTDVAGLFNNRLMTTDVRFCRFEDVTKLYKYLKNAEGYKIVGIYAEPETFDKFEKEGSFETVRAGKECKTVLKKSLGCDILGCESIDRGYFSFDSYISNSLNEVLEQLSEIKFTVNSQTGLIQNTYEETKL